MRAAELKALMLKEHKLENSRDTVTELISSKGIDIKTHKTERSI